MEHGVRSDDEARVLDAALRALLDQRPDALVAAINPEGLFVTAPPEAPFGRHPVAQARSALDLVQRSETMKVIEAWERARAEGGTHVQVRLAGDQAGFAQLHFFDVSPLYGVYVGVLVPLDGSGAQLDEIAAIPAPPPRLCRVRKDELARVLWVDDAATAMLGWTRDELMTRRSLDFIHPDDHEVAIGTWMEVLANPGGTCRTRVRHQHRDGRWLWVEIANRNALDDPDQGYIEAEMFDITEEMEAHEAVRASEQLLRRLAETLPVGVVQFDTTPRIRYANDALYEILGLSREATEEDMFGCVVEGTDVIVAVTEVLAGRDIDLDVRIDRADGSGRRHCTVALRALTDSSGEVTGAVACMTDVTDDVRLRAELERRASHDPLTSCVNRATVMAMLEQALDAEGAEIAAVFVDLDDFKAVNDRLGHAVGDAVLVAVGERLRRAVREGDVVGRLGGDEFLLVCRGVGDGATAQELGARVAASLRAPVELHGHRVEPRASVGVAWAGESGTTDAEALVARADQAMYRSKRNAGGKPVLAGSTPPAPGTAA